MNPKKIVAALILLPFFIWLIGWGQPWLLMCIVFPLGVLLGSYEFARIAFGPNCWFETIMGMVVSTPLAFFAAMQNHTAMLAGISGAFLLLFIIYLIREKEVEKILDRTAKTFFGVIYIGIFSGLVVALKSMEVEVEGFKLVMLLFALIWINDAAAYFTGTLAGKRKLAPNISPGKTIEGSVGGFIATILLALILAGITDLLTLKDGLILGVLLGVLGPLGDLCESALKRGAGVKDSGILIPGHGGILDRVDSVLFGAPILYFYTLVRFLG